MKLNIEMDCSAEEARTFLGLPDLKPLQTKVLARVEQQLLEATSTFTPEGVLKMWFSVLPQASEQYLHAFGELLKSKSAPS